MILGVNLSLIILRKKINHSDPELRQNSVMCDDQKTFGDMIINIHDSMLEQFSDSHQLA